MFQMQQHLTQIDWGKSICQEDRVMLSELYADQCLQSLLAAL